MLRYFLLFSILHFVSCDGVHDADTVPPLPPRGVDALALDNAVEVSWIRNGEPDLAGYNVWRSDRYDGRYALLGSTTDNVFMDNTARNGVTYYYAVSAYDFDRNESSLSPDVVSATPRPEGYGVQLADYRTIPTAAGYDFSTYSVGHYNDDYTDVFYEHFNGRYYLNVWSDTDIQDMGYTATLDDIRRAPTSGWSPSKSVEAIPGHTYVVWTWDNHYAKLRVRSVTAGACVFDWAYQTARGVTSLKRSGGDRTAKPRTLKPPVHQGSK